MASRRAFRFRTSLSKFQKLQTSAYFGFCQNIIKQFWGMFYTVPLAALGGMTTNKACSGALKIIGFFLVQV